MKIAKCFFSSLTKLSMSSTKSRKPSWKRAAGSASFEAIVLHGLSNNTHRTMHGGLSGWKAARYDPPVQQPLMVPQRTTLDQSRDSDPFTPPVNWGELLTSSLSLCMFWPCRFLKKLYYEACEKSACYMYLHIASSQHHFGSESLTNKTCASLQLSLSKIFPLGVFTLQAANMT